MRRVDTTENQEWLVQENKVALNPGPLGYEATLPNNKRCFVQTLLIKLFSLQADRLNIFFLQENQQCCTSVRNLIGQRRKKHSSQRDSNPQPLCHEVYTLPLCCNHCPTQPIIIVLSIFYFSYLNANIFISVIWFSSNFLAFYSIYFFLESQLRTSNPRGIIFSSFYAGQEWLFQYLQAIS